MNKTAIIYWGSLFVWGILISLFWIKVAKDSYSVISTPVEEMYHRQLVVTLDSILDARFDDGCCNKLVDKDTIDIAKELCSFENIADIKQ